jgi:hypothetical protein
MLAYEMMKTIISPSFDGGNLDIILTKINK